MTQSSSTRTVARVLLVSGLVLMVAGLILGAFVSAIAFAVATFGLVDVILARVFTRTADEQARREATGGLD